MRKKLFYIVLLFSISLTFSQTDEEKKKLKKENDLIVTNNNNAASAFVINPLAPAKAAFYSAILPGLGQAYNKKYWIIPVIYGGMGASMYAYTFYNKEYNRYLTAYKLEIAGKPHEFENFDKTALERGINFNKKNRDLYLFVTIGVYILNIVEANVDAHLPNHKIDTNLSYNPSITIDPVSNQLTYGAQVTFNF